MAIGKTPTERSDHDQSKQIRRNFFLRGLLYHPRLGAMWVVELGSCIGWMGFGVTGFFNCGGLFTGLGLRSLFLICSFQPEDVRLDGVRHA